MFVDTLRFIIITLINVVKKIVTVVMGIFFVELLVTGNSVEEIAAVQDKVKNKLVLTDKKELENYLGVVSKIDENTLLLHQIGYAKKILERFRMTVCQEATTPLPRDLISFKSQLDGFSKRRRSSSAERI
jgi:hypothetical protein